MHILDTGYSNNDMKNNMLCGDGIDRLTGLYNGKYAEEKIESYIKEHQDERIAIYVMDIDNFQAVDDNLGRLFGNEVLKEMAIMIQQIFDSEDIIGRIGGDKFIVCQKNCGLVEDIEQYAGRLCRKARNAYTADTKDCVISLSIGIAVAPTQGVQSDILIKKAKKALLYVKKNGKDAFEFYEEFMNTQISVIDELDTAGKLYISPERAEGENKKFDSFGYELIDLAFRLMDETKDVKNAINLLIRKVGIYYKLSAVAVREMVNKPRTLRYVYEYVDNRNIPTRCDSEWQYSREEWKRFRSHFKAGYYLYYHSEGIPFDIPEIENQKLTYQTFLEIPIINNGQIVGCIDFVSLDRERHYSNHDIKTLKMFTRLISSYLMNMRNYYNVTLKLEELNDHDAMTGLMKYNAFHKKMRGELNRMSRDTYIAIVYCDLRHFKYINETYGYDVGNKLLKKFSSKAIRDVSGFLGGARVYSDNIVIAVKYANTRSDMEVCEWVSKRVGNLNKELQDSFMDNNITICAGISIIKSPKIDLEIAISNANMARKEAKKKEIDTVVLFDDEMMKMVVRQMQLNAELPSALQNGNIKVYYQPKIESGTGKIVGAEALVRWQKDDGTFVYPDDFVPGFEENGMIVDVDYYVYEQVFRMISERLSAGFAIVPVSMNISSVHLKEGDFLNYVQSLFEKYPIPAEYVEFELTESIYIKNLKAALELISGLQKMGIKISMDDFGSGYSSLNLLNNLPIDILKLDKIFLDGNKLTVNQKVIISCVVEMASKLNIRVVCEGVETSEQVNFLTVIGCEMIQGYYYAKPMPTEQFVEYIDKHIKIKPYMVCFSFDETLKDTTGKYKGYCLGEKAEFSEGPFPGKKALLMRGGDILHNVVAIPTEVYKNNSYTIAFWAKVNKEGIWSAAVTMEFDNGFNSVMPTAGDYKPDFRIKLVGEDNIWHDTSSQTSMDKRWHYYVATYNAQTKVAILYIDAKIAGYTENVSMLNGIDRILVGGDVYAAPFSGKIANLKIFNQSLSKTDICMLYSDEQARRS